MQFVKFITKYGQTVYIKPSAIEALFTHATDIEVKVLGCEYTGPITYIQLGNGTEEAGYEVRGSVEEVAARMHFILS